MQRAILYKSSKQHLTKHHLHGHLSPILKNIQPRRTRHADYYWRRKGEPTRTYLHRLCADTGGSLTDSMDDRDGWGERERVREIHAVSATWWWWWWWWSLHSSTLNEKNLTFIFGQNTFWFCDDKEIQDNFGTFVVFMPGQTCSYIYIYIYIYVYVCGVIFIILGLSYPNSNPEGSCFHSIYL